MTNEYNPYLKSPEELDFDLEANSSVYNIEIGRNRPKDYLITDEEIENSSEENSNINISNSTREDFLIEELKDLTILKSPLRN